MYIYIHISYTYNVICPVLACNSHPCPPFSTATCLDTHLAGKDLQQGMAQGAAGDALNPLGQSTCVTVGPETSRGLKKQICGIPSGKLT